MLTLDPAQARPSLAAPCGGRGLRASSHTLGKCVQGMDALDIVGWL